MNSYGNWNAEETNVTDNKYKTMDGLPELNEALKSSYNIYLK